MTAKGDTYHDDQPQLPEGVHQASPEEGGGSYLYFDNRLFVAKKDVEATLAELHRRQLGCNVLGLSEGSFIDDDSDFAILEVDPGNKTLPQLVTELRRLSLGGLGEQLDVSPDHVMVAFGHPIPLGATCPAPAEPPVGPFPAPHESFPGLPGHGVRVAVLDTGYLDKHPWLGRVTGLSPDDLETLPPNGQVLPRYYGHGTFVAGMVVQHAPGVQILARNVLSGGGSDGELSFLGLHDFGMISDCGPRRDAPEPAGEHRHHQPVARRPDARQSRAPVTPGRRSPG